jgi:hypothetical protein
MVWGVRAEAWLHRLAAMAVAGGLLGSPVAAPVAVAALILAMRSRAARQAILKASPLARSI